MNIGQGGSITPLNQDLGQKRSHTERKEDKEKRRA